MKRIVNIVRSLPVVVGCLFTGIVYGQSEVVLENQAMSIKWQQTPTGYKLSVIQLTPSGQVLSIANPESSEEHTSELKSLMRISYAVFCLTKKQNILKSKNTSYNAK